MSLKLNEVVQDKIVRYFGPVVLTVFLTYFCFLVQYPLIIPFLLFILGIHLNYFKKAKASIFLRLGLLITILIFTAHLFEEYYTISSVYIPVAAIAMLTMLLFNDLQLSSIIALVGSVIVSLIIGGNFGIMLTFFIGALTGAYAVRHARNRSRLLGAGFIVSLSHLICILLLNPDFHLFLNPKYASQYIYPWMINGIVSSFFVMATLRIFEYLFGVLTNFTLLELSDFDQPLLKRLILEAPGTYHHSLIVGNLSEAAAESIGANGLLTRVGAYYHDVGKLVQPEYFTENQLGGGNKHDDIEPNISRLVILNHVKEGIELAHKYKLNQQIIDFIPEHHGTSLIHYFYQRSLEEAQEGEVVEEEDFRYPGPKPQSRETAITLLADSVEGATRSLDEHTPTKIEETVKKVINNKFIDGQLDESNLSLKDIDHISQTFIRILTAMYHSRVKYPGQKNGSSPRKSSEKQNSSNKSPSSGHPKHS